MTAAILTYFASHGLELAGLTTTVLGIWLTIRRALLCWPITLAADLLYLVVFYQARLFSDAILQLFFLAFTLYGWWHWWRGFLADGEVRVETMSVREGLAAIAAGALGSLLLGAVMVRIGAALPYLDATLASYSLVGSWWGARKYIANWWLWIAVDLVYIGEYIYKGLWATGLLYAGLVVLAILGLREWSRAAANQATTDRAIT